MNKIRAACAALLFLTSTYSFCQQPALLIDTDGKTTYDYRNFLSLLESVGYAPDYQNLFSFLNSSKIEKYETIFFELGASAMSNIKNNFVQKCIKSVQNYAQSGNKNIAILLSGNQKTAFVNRAISLLENLGVPVDEGVRSFIHNLFAHDGKTGHLYGTTLINKKENKPTVPHPFPPALFLTNKKLNNNYLITKASTCTFSEIAENFFLVPLSFATRQKLLASLQRMLKKFYLMARVNGRKKTKLPGNLTKKFNIAQKKEAERKMYSLFHNNPNYRWLIDKKLSCAWLDPGDYFLEQRKPATSLPEKEKKILKQAAMKRGLDFIHNSGINLLWFELNPESFLSVKNDATPETQKKFENKVRTLGKELKKRFNKNKNSRPKIFIGTDITSNYRSHPVHIAVRDFFGKTYSKIPSPLDFKHFWKPELLDVFDRFTKIFGADIPIDGIFLDFEMYHAQRQAGSYSSLMDFSDLAWKIYADRTGQPQLLTKISVQSRVSYLIENNLFEQYFSTLSAEAKKIGKQIRTHIKKKYPNILIGAYAPTLPRNWFYRGLLAGLSSQTQPVIYVSFNTDFYSHAPWLEQQGIYLMHGAPIMLSKLKKTSDFRLISKLSRLHYFIWYNRPSRMIYQPEQRKNIWWSSEASLLPWKKVAKEIQRYTKKEKQLRSIYPPTKL